jgi:DNA methylase
VAAISLDTEFLPQDALDLVSRERTSIYPWRGQFSPGLVGLLLEAYGHPGDVVLDPFVGSGTTLFEAVRRQHPCVGAEINPAAGLYARIACLSSLSAPARRRLLSQAETMLMSHIGSFRELTLLSSASPALHHETLAQAIRHLMGEAAKDEDLYAVLAASVMLAMGHDHKVSAEGIEGEFWRNSRIVTDLPFATTPCSVILTDARDLPLDRDTIDVVITSPPYINVFNYHQYHRAAVELLGWDALRVAQSEIGANRKHRGNRFLTVIQFCLDMFDVFHEIRRVLRPTGTSVIVVGHESNVRGISFNNGVLLAILAKGSGMAIERRQQRKFINRFGKTIYEDILTLKHQNGASPLDSDFARRVGSWALERREPLARGDVKADLRDALARAPDVIASPIMATGSVLAANAASA